MLAERDAAAEAARRAKILALPDAAEGAEALARHGEAGSRQIKGSDTAVSMIPRYKLTHGL